MGTGNNIGYLEKIENIPNFSGNSATGYMAVNTELAHVSTEHSASFEHLYNAYDDEIDANSADPGLMRYGKLFYSMFFGEVLSLALHEINTKVPAFLQSERIMMNTASSIDSSLPVKIADASFVEAGIYVESFAKTATVEEVAVIKSVCEAICRRSTLMQAAGNAAVALKICEIGKTG